MFKGNVVTLHIANHKTMVLIMKRILIFIFFLQIFYSQSLAQHLKYSEFMRLTKIERWSDINNIISINGYVWVGSVNNKKVIRAAWTKNCSDFEFIDDNNTCTWNKDNDETYSFFYIKHIKNNNYKLYSFNVNSKTIFNSYLKEAKNNGFVFLYEELKDNNIVQTYRKNKTSSTNGFDEYFIFYTSVNNEFTIEYYPFGLFDNDEINNIAQQNNFPTSTSTQKECSTGYPAISGLEGYTLEYSQTRKCPGPGSVIVRVIVSPSGKVIKASIVGGSNINSKARDICLSIAKECRFKVPKSQKTDKTGTLTYTIK